MIFTTVANMVVLKCMENANEMYFLFFLFCQEDYILPTDCLSVCVFVCLFLCLSVC